MESGTQKRDTWKGSELCWVGIFFNELLQFWVIGSIKICMFNNKNKKNIYNSSSDHSSRSNNNNKKLFLILNKPVNMGKAQFYILSL